MLLGLGLQLQAWSGRAISWSMESPRHWTCFDPWGRSLYLSPITLPSPETNMPTSFVLWDFLLPRFFFFCKTKEPKQNSCVSLSLFCFCRMRYFRHLLLPLCTWKSINFLLIRRFPISLQYSTFSFLFFYLFVCFTA